MSNNNAPKDLQIVGLVLAILLTARLVDEAGGMNRAFWLFLATIPVCAVGLVIYKIFIGHEFERPKSWPEWILMYFIGMLIGGIAVGLAIAIYQAFFNLLSIYQ